MTLQSYAREQQPKLPLNFEANLGHTDSRVFFLVRDHGYTRFFAHNEAVLTFPSATGSQSAISIRDQNGQPRSAVRNETGVLRKQFANANPQAHVVGLDERHGKSNYFIGNDPQRWRIGIPHYAKIKYEAVYPAKAGSSDAFVTKLTHRGTSPIYSTYLGGADFDQSIDDGIAVDRQGYAYVTGLTWSSDFPITADAFQTASAGGGVDAFVTKLNRRGKVLTYSSYLGGNSIDLGFGIEVDHKGGVYVTEFTLSTDFPTTPGVFQECSVVQ
jgi:hypothetical protein